MSDKNCVRNPNWGAATLCSEEQPRDWTSTVCPEFDGVASCLVKVSPKTRTFSKSTPLLQKYAPLQRTQDFKMKTYIFWKTFRFRGPLELQVYKSICPVGSDWRLLMWQHWLNSCTRICFENLWNTMFMNLATLSFGFWRIFLTNIAVYKNVLLHVNNKALETLRLQRWWSLTSAGAHPHNFVHVHHMSTLHFLPSQPWQYCADFLVYCTSHISVPGFSFLNGLASICVLSPETFSRPFTFGEGICRW